MWRVSRNRFTMLEAKMLCMLLARHRPLWNSRISELIGIIWSKIREVERDCHKEGFLEMMKKGMSFLNLWNKIWRIMDRLLSFGMISIEVVSRHRGRLKSQDKLRSLIYIHREKTKRIWWQEEGGKIPLVIRKEEDKISLSYITGWNSDRILSRFNR